MAERRSKTSLAFRLNGKLFFRQLRTMLWLDVLICVLFALGLMYCLDAGSLEKMQAYTGAAASGAGRHPAVGASDLAGDTGLAPDAAVYRTGVQPPAFYLPDRLTQILPAPLDGRPLGRFLLPGEYAAHWHQYLQGFIYQVSLRQGEDWLVAAMPIGRPLAAFTYAFFALLVWEFFSLLGSLRKNGRSIAKAMKPLEELTTQAQALTAKGGRLSPEALVRLTGALDSINVSHLDTRLPLAGISEELKPLTAAINEMLARIDEAYHSQIQFVSDASHELRTPIAVIQGYADLLTRWGTEDPDTMRESIQAIRQEAQAMKELVEQLLFLARGDVGSTNLAWNAVDLSQLGAEVYREIEMIDESHQFAAGITPDVIVQGDDGLLKQLMRILMDNSVKYTPTGGKVTLRVEDRAGQAAIVVQDEGAGIPEKALPYIFDRFYRADESRARHTGGTGLGLAIAKWIAQRHNGLIEVLSREGIGTRMTVLLPLVIKEGSSPSTM